MAILGALVNRHITGHLLLAWIALLWGGCEQPRFLVFELIARPEMAPVDRVELDIQLGNYEVKRTFRTTTFPQSFSIQITSDEALTARAMAYQGDALVATSEPTVRLRDDVVDRSVLELYPNDFVLNREIESAQSLSASIGSFTNGASVWARDDGSFVVHYVEGCEGGACNLHLRSFTRTGLPQGEEMMARGGTLRHEVEYTVTFASYLVSLREHPLMLYREELDFGARNVVMCKPENGAAVAFEEAPHIDEAYAHILTPEVAGLVWTTSQGGANLIKLARVNADCTLRGAVAVVRSDGGTGEGSARVLFDGSLIRVAWHDYVTGVNYLRSYDLDGVAQGQPEVIEPSGRVHSLLGMPTGWAMAFTKSQSPGNGSHLYLRRYSVAGMPVGEATQITTTPAYAISGVSVTQPGREGRVLLVWSDCPDDSFPCDADVHARLLDSEGRLVGDERIVNTTTRQAQYAPSVIQLPALDPRDETYFVAFTDESATLPDTDREAVRGRFMYGSQLALMGGLGMPCRADGCDAPLRCMGLPDGATRCAAPCEQPGQACSSGGMCTALEVGSVCQ